MDAFLEIVIFGAKALLLVISFILVLSAILRASKSSSPEEGKLKVKKLNQGHKKTALQMGLAMSQDKKERKALIKAHKAEKGAPKGPRTFVLNFDGNVKASQVPAFTREVNAILSVAKPEDAVLLRLKSPGGVVSGYGLAAQQLVRLRERGLKLTAVVDEVAASGGYMMAVVAHRIVIAPFAVVGSIGVVAGMPNIHRWLKEKHIDYELLTAGEYKRTLTMLGENTEEGRKKFLEDLQSIHAHFKAHCESYRPSLDMERVATGEHWFGKDALDLGLVDALGSSEDLIDEAIQAGEVFELQWEEKKSIGDKLGFMAERSFDKVWNRILGLHPKNSIF